MASNDPNQPDIIWNNQSAELTSRAVKGRWTWLESPAMLKLLAQSRRDLIKLSRDRGIYTGQVKKVKAARPSNSTKVYIVPTDDEDPSGIEVKVSRGGEHWVNLRSLLSEGNFLVPVRTARLYQLQLAGRDSPVGPALVFDLEQVEGSRLLKKQKQDQQKQTQLKTKPKDEASKPTDEKQQGA